MALTQSDLDAIDQAIASGELTVSYNGRTTTFRSVDELLKARAHVAKMLGVGGTSTGWPAGRHVARFTDGLC